MDDESGSNEGSRSNGVPRSTATIINHHAVPDHHGCGGSRDMGQSFSATQAASGRTLTADGLKPVDCLAGDAPLYSKMKKVRILPCHRCVRKGWANGRDGRSGNNRGKRRACDGERWAKSHPVTHGTPPRPSNLTGLPGLLLARSSAPARSRPYSWRAKSRTARHTRLR